MFEKPVDYADCFNILTYIFYFRNERKHSSYDKPDFNSCIACLIKAFNNFSISKIIHFQVYIGFLP